MKNMIREFRNARGMSQRDLAKAVGTSQQQIQRIENAKQAIKMHMAGKICDALRCELSDVFPGVKGHENLLNVKLLPKKLPTMRQKMEAELTTGMDTDEWDWTLVLMLNGGKKHFFSVSAGTIERLKAFVSDHQVEDRFQNFFCFCSRNADVAVNLKHVIHFYTLSHPETNHPLSQGEDYPEDQIRITLDGVTESLDFGIDPDRDPCDYEPGNFTGQFSDLIHRLQFDAYETEFISFIDEDEQPAFFRVNEVALVIVSQNTNTEDYNLTNDTTEIYDSHKSDTR